MIAIPYDNEEESYDVSFRDLAAPTRKNVALGDRLTPTGLARLNTAARHSRSNAGAANGPHRRRQKRSYV